MRVLITGANGFAGSYLVDHLTAAGHTIYGMVLPSELNSRNDWPFTPLGGNLLEIDSLRKAVADSRPDVIYHLAGQADVGLSWRRPALTLQVNAVGTANLLETIVEYGRPRLIAVTTADLYGPQPVDAMPINGFSQPKPYHPYAVSKLAASELLSIYHQRYGLEIIEARPFNHIGARQALGFVVPDFASQIAAIKLGQKSPQIKVGNLDAERDFTDARDVTRAYTCLAADGTPGATYLICSGRPVSIRSILNMLIEIAGVDVKIENDPNRMRPSDTPLLYGSYDKIFRDTGWKPEISLRESLTSVLAAWEQQLSN